MEFVNKKEGDLDAMIGAHKSYLDRIVKKILLISSKSRKEVCHFFRFFIPHGVVDRLRILSNK